jgi:hypothetical protein
MPAPKKIASIAFAGAAAAAAAGYGADPALAASGHWHIKNGTTGYHGVIKAKNKGTTVLLDKTHSLLLTCKKVSVSGSVPKSSVLATGSSTRLGTLKMANMTSCSWLGVTFRLHLLKKAGIFGRSFKSGVTHGKIKSISIQISGVNVIECKAKLKGRLPAVFKNASHTFVVDSKSAESLTFFSVTKQCPIWKTNDKAYYKATFPVSTPKALNVSEK